MILLRVEMDQHEPILNSKHILFPWTQSEKQVHKIIKILGFWTPIKHDVRWY